MSFQSKIILREDFIEVVGTGDADFDSLAAMITALISHPGWSPGSLALVDYRAVNAGPLRVDEVSRLAEMVSENRDRIGKARIAHLVTRDLEYGLVRMWDAYVHKNWDGTAVIFRSRDEAVAWLGSPAA